MSLTTASYPPEHPDRTTEQEDHAALQDVPVIIESDADADTEAEERGRLKRRRKSSHSPPRAASPSRGHDRDSGSRHRHHRRNFHRDSESASMTPPPGAYGQKKQRRRSDAEPDHTFRGRARNRSGSRERTGSPIFEDDDASEEEVRELRRRAQPPSRPRADIEEDEVELRRQRSYTKLHRKDSKGEGQKGESKRPHPLSQEL